MSVLPSTFEPLLELDFVEVDPPVIGRSTVFHVGVSGGKDSIGALLWMVRESGIAHGKIQASFCDIGNDHQWTLDHVRLISDTVFPIQTIKPEKDFFELALHKRRFPSTKARFCTEHLKIEPTRNHIQRLRYYGLQVIAVSGVRAEESKDRKDLPEWAFSSTLGCYSWRPLIKWRLANVLAIHQRYDVPLNPLYAIGAQRVGCWPCIMSRKAEIRTIALMFPERIDEIRKYELEFEKRYGRYSSFFARNAVPERFRTKEFIMKTGEVVMVASIDDVVRWSMTGDRAQGSYLDGAEKQSISCQSGFCE